MMLRAGEALAWGVRPQRLHVFDADGGQRLSAEMAAAA